MELEKIILKLKSFVSDLDTPAAELIKEQTQDPFHVLLATILSSRTNDKTTIQAAKRLFSRVNSFEDLKRIKRKKLEELIYPVGFYRVKADHLKKLSSFKQVPDTREKLLELPGVGRKTANLVLSVAFNKPAICVDVHVHRISNRLGHISTSTTLETEQQLEALLPEKTWHLVNRVFVPFGQSICRPINPRCPLCPVEPFCAKRIKNPKIKKAK
ncbi:MAG: endonuclease III domain-containing protein [Candidatus Woesearchaeota archaeon]